jgi:endo-alpha-1,4-polygalactosaminidase (GH114 family)
MAEKILTKGMILRIAESARNPQNRLHIISRNGKWAVKKEGAKRAFGIYATKDKAIEIATARVRAGKTEEAVVHDLYGHVSQKIV